MRRFLALSILCILVIAGLAWSVLRWTGRGMNAPRPADIRVTVVPVRDPKDGIFRIDLEVAASSESLARTTVLELRGRFAEFLAPRSPAAKVFLPEMVSASQDDMVHPAMPRITTVAANQYASAFYVLVTGTTQGEDRLEVRPCQIEANLDGGPVTRRISVESR